MTNSINFSSIDKALNSLERALLQPKNEYTRDAVIQRFEYSYELTWKLLKRCLAEYYGSEEANIKNLYREAAKIGLISNNLESWFEYHSARNLTVHTYNEDTADETYEKAKPFCSDAKKLIEKLKETARAT